MMFSKYIYEPERINILFYGMIAFVLIPLSIFFGFCLLCLSLKRVHQYII